jgi:AcrR family transcriptional regulator
MSQRRVKPPPREHQILDAAHTTVLDFGLKRATVLEVAKRAGVSRMTVYRRYPDGAALIRALMTREFSAVLDRARAEVGEKTSGRERVVAAAGRTIEALLTHPLMLRLLELEPEVLFPYVTNHVGRFQQLALDVLTEAIAEGQSDGTIRPGEPARLAATIETAARGFVYAARSYGDDEREAVVAEVERMVDAYLQPQR